MVMPPGAPSPYSAPAPGAAPYGAPPQAPQYPAQPQYSAAPQYPAPPQYPAYAQPTSGVPGAPVSAAPYGAPYGSPGYPTAYPPAQPPKKGLGGGAIAAIVGGVAAVGLLAAGGVTAFVVLSGAPLQNCVVGSWEATSYEVDYGDAGSATMDGVRMQWKSSGTSTTFFTGASRSDSGGDTVELGGTATFSYSIDGDEISYTNGRGNAGAEWLGDYTETASCDGDSLTLTGEASDGSASWTVNLRRE
jgi:hypothetical protein